MIPSQTPAQAKTCRAQAVLTAQEAHYLNALPGADFMADAQPLGCDFMAHLPGVRHVACAQMQYTGAGSLVLWWLLWGEDGHRELRTALGCRKGVVDETCLLIDGHPGDCDQDCGWSREGLKKALDATAPSTES